MSYSKRLDCITKLANYSEQQYYRYIDVSCVFFSIKQNFESVLLESEPYAEDERIEDDEYEHQMLQVKHYSAYVCYFIMASG